MPDDWQTTTLGEAVSLDRSRMDPSELPSNEQLVHWSIPALDEIGGPTVDDAGSIGSHKFKVINDCVLLSLLNPRIPRFTLALGGPSVVCSTEFAVMVPQEKVSLNFLYCTVSSFGFFDRFKNLAQGTTKSRERVRAKELEKIEISVPPLAEQRRIVDLVGAIDACIDALETQIEATRTARAGVLAELLSTPEDDWQTTTLGEVVSIRTGKLDVNASVKEGKFPFFTCARETYFIDIAAFSGQSVIVAGNGDFNVKYFDGDFNAYQRTYVLQSCDRELLLNRFLYHLINERLSTFRKGSQGTTIKYLKKAQFTDLDISLPPLSEQRRIVDLVGAIDACIDALETQVAADRIARAGVLAELLSGEHRLPESYDKFVEAS